MTYNSAYAPIQTFLTSLSQDFETLVGHSKIRYSYRRNNNTSQLLFNKYGFCQLNNKLQDQKCAGRNCLTCKTMFDKSGKLTLYDGNVVRLSETANCKTEDIIYIFVCKFCGDYYFGQSISQFNLRCNGHRDKFKLTNDAYKKSALSSHIYADHPDNFGLKLGSYHTGILETCAPMQLNRREDYYIWKTQADARHLNRIKVAR